MGLCKKCSLFLVGAGVGAAVGVAFAPKSGRDVRQELFGREGDVYHEPGSEAETPGMDEEAPDEDLQQKIDETRERLKAEIEAQPES